MGQFHFVRVDRLWIDGEVVVMRGDFDLAGYVVPYRVIAAVMAELELVGFAAEREATELVAEADAEDRYAAYHLPNRLHGIFDRLGIAGTVREKNAIGLERQHVFG